MSTLTLDQGSGDSWTIPAANENGALVYSGTETLSAKIWPGGTQAAIATLVPTWVTPAAGLTDLTIPGTLTATLAPGIYRLTCTVTDANGPHDYYRGYLEILPGPGSTAAVQSYIADSDLQTYAAWINQVQADSDQVGFGAECGQATMWLNEIIISRWKYISYSPQIGQPGWGAWSMTWGQDPFPSTWLRQQLAAGTLMIRPFTVEIVARKAIGYICGAQLGKNGDTSYRKLSKAFHREANELVKVYRAEIDLNADGYADILVNCGATNLR